MEHQSIIPENESHWLELRKPDITSTESAMMFGISPYATIYELWHTKQGNMESTFKPNKRTEWGQALEDVIAAKVAEELGISVAPMKQYMRIPELKIGSSFDYSIGEDGILEIKNVDSLIYHQQWTEEEAPLHIEMQVQHQLLVSNRKYVIIAALVGGNDLKIIRRERNEAVIEQIIKKASEFWATIRIGEEPSPDFTRDVDAIKALYNTVEPGTVMEATQELNDLAATHREIKKQIKELEVQEKALTAQMKIIVGENEKAIGDNYSITASEVAGCDMSYYRKPYRLFKVNHKKEK